MSRHIADTTKLDHELNDLYRLYHEKYCHWRNPNSPLKTTPEDVPTFAAFVEMHRQELEAERRRAFPRSPLAKSNVPV